MRVDVEGWTRWRAGSGTHVLLLPGQVREDNLLSLHGIDAGGFVFSWDQAWSWWREDEALAGMALRAWWYSSKAL